MKKNMPLQVDISRPVTVPIGRIVKPMFGAAILVLLSLFFIGCERNDLFDMASDTSSAEDTTVISSIHVIGAAVSGGGPDFYWHRSTSAGDDLGVISGSSITNFNNVLDITMRLTESISAEQYFLITWGTSSSSASIERTYIFYDTEGTEITTITHSFSSAAMICREGDFVATGDTFTLFYFDGTTVAHNQVSL